MSMMSAIEDSQVATTSKEIQQEGGIDEDAEMIDVVEEIEEEKEEEEELMVSLDNRIRKMFQKHKLSQQLFTTPLKKMMTNI